MAFVVFLVIFAMNFIESATQSANHQSLLEDAQKLIQEEASKCDTGDEQCIDSATADAARATGVIEACKDLEGDKYASCVTLIAFDKLDPKLCKILDGEERVRCEDGALLLLARDTKNGELCTGIQDEITRLSCEGSLRASVVLQDQELTDILEKGTIADCNKLDDEVRDTCKDLFTSLDEDEDGLTLAEEREAGTDPAKADTDGDGYTDGVEVSAGYDPLK